VSEAPPEEPGAVLSVHFGRSANCSSIGSIVDFLFLSTVAASAVVAATAVLLAGREAQPPEPPTPLEETLTEGDADEPS
jgi:hypothetical protein